jgi:2'-5' RNA ligase
MTVVGPAIRRCVLPIDDIDEHRIVTHFRPCDSMRRHTEANACITSVELPMDDRRPVRVFVGVKVAPTIAIELAQLARDLDRPSVRLVAADDIHLTLVPPWSESVVSEAIDKLNKVAGEFNAFSLTFQHVGYGPQPKRPRLLWAECLTTDDIVALRTALLEAYGQRDERPFRPHVTLARIRGFAIARKFPIDRDLSFTQRVETIELFQSPPSGERGYRILASSRLGESNGRDRGRPTSEQKGELIMTATQELNAAVQATEDWIDDLMRRLGWHDRERVYLGLLATFHALRDCLGRDEAVYVGAHLPPLLRGLYYEGWHPRGPAAAKDRAGFLARIHDGMHRDPAVDPEQVARAVFALLAARLPTGEIEDAKAATPKALHNLWP